MAINRSTQQRQNYGLGSFVKKAVNKVTRPFVKVAQKVMPKELAGIARMAAPFLPPGYREAAYFAGTAKQKGRISPLDVALMTAPFAAKKFSYTPGQGLTSVGFNEADAARSGAMDFNQFFRGKVPYGDKIADTLVGSPFDPGNSSLGAGDPGLPPMEATQGLIGSGGQMSQLLGDGPGIMESKLGQLALGQKENPLTTFKEAEKLSKLKLGSWGLGIYSGIQAKKYKDEQEAADAAEQALLAEDSAASEAAIANAREWAQTVFGRLSRADIGLAQGGRVNYAMGTGPVLPPDPTKPVNPFAPKPTGPVLPNKEMAMSYGYDDAMSDTYSLFLQMKDRKEIPIDMDFDEFLMEVVPEMSKKQTMEDKPMAANGGLMRSNYALGTKPEPKESGLGGLPIEADMRYSGGFMPYGKKEKADDVPARLSKNEFVFTADAVRAAGGGSMNEGARKMYQTMKMLEQQNRMMS